jgi:predicted nucleic acid-binding protein
MPEASLSSMPAWSSNRSCPTQKRLQSQAALEGPQDAINFQLYGSEITSALTKAVHFGQLTETEGQVVLHKALMLGVQVVLPDEVQSNLAFDWTRQLQRASAYDSFYLVTAEALDAELWTADHRLVRALGEHKPVWLHWVGE